MVQIFESINAAREYNGYVFNLMNMILFFISLLHLYFLLDRQER